ncbi:uncharacterized protein LOC108865015 [Galendromus occidentalis]|uniref:Uncharacterized protein LOC108865015 n=1 Tax=Galendromus occidentalis TaxID=34638 RepID=A0AAJ7L8G6_9ACAR|nr:uncharacterized protein LOC108865015 [Galendromus occidentalis]
MSVTDKQTSIELLRKPIRSAIEKFARSLNELIATRDGTPVEEYSRKLRCEMATLNRIRSQAASTVSQETYEAEYRKMDEFARHLDHAQGAIIEEGMARIKPSSNKILGDISQFDQTQQTVMNGSRGENLNESQLDNVLTRLAVVQEQQSHHLPVLEIRKFSGDVTTFYAWWDEFKVNIHDRPHMTKSQFTYLRNFLEGEAAMSTEKTLSSGANYGRTLNYLFDRYGNAESIAIEIFTQLLRMPDLPKFTDNSKLGEYLDKVTSH